MAVEGISDDEISLTSTVGSDQKSAYEVEAILAEDKWPDGMRYLVQWVGYSLDRCTWEPADSFNFSDTLHDWEKKKQQISDGKESAFDVQAWEERLRQLQEEKNERNRRRSAKRRKFASSEATRSPKSDKVTPSVHRTSPHKVSNASTSRPRGPGSSSLFIDRVHPARQGLIGSSASKPPPVLFGSSQTTSEPVRSKKVPTTDKPKLFNTLSTKWKYEKLGRSEPTPDINQLDLRRPSEWTTMSSANTMPLGNPHLITDSTDNGPTAYAPGSDLGSPLISHAYQKLPIAKPSMNNGSRKISSPDQNRTFKPPSNDPSTYGDLQAPPSEFNLEFPPREPTRTARFVNPKRWWNQGDLYVSMYFGPEKLDIGNVRLCGIGYEERKGLYKTKVGKTIEVWFRDLCTLDEYNTLCDGVPNTKIANGWVEGFNDTEPRIRNAAKSLWRENRVAIAYINSSRRNEVLLAYPPRSPNFSFLDAGPEKGYLNLTLRNPLGPIDRLRPSAKSNHPHLEEVNNTFKSAHVEPNIVSAPGVVKLSRSFDAAKENIGQFSTASPTLDSPDEHIHSPSFPSPIIRVPTDKPLVQRAIHPSTEPMDLGARPTQASTPSNVGSNFGAALNLDELFSSEFGITFAKLATIGGTDKPQRAEMVFVWFPEDSELIRAEKELMMAFLKNHTTLLYSNSVGVDWERFVTMVKKNTMQGVVLFHESFVQYDKIPFLKEVLRKSAAFWTVSISQPLKYVDRPLHIQRLFPHGGVFLLTEDFMLREPDAAMVILEWFYELTKKKFPGNWKIMLRPDIMNWVLKQVDLPTKSKQSWWLAIYHLLKKLGFSPSDGLLPSIEYDHSDVVSPPTLPMYGYRTADDSPNIPRDCSQEQRDADHLAEFFAGWSLLNAHRFRRFFMVTALDPLERWTKWQHIDIKKGSRDFYQAQSINPEPILARLVKGAPKSGSSSAEHSPYTPRAPRSFSYPAPEKGSTSSTTQVPFRRTYGQPYQ
ncbi:hypothetical protein BJX76DRAFT_332418 [Aspergillus varians]